MKSKNALDDLYQSIRLHLVNIKVPGSFSHNLIALDLGLIAKTFGRAEANKVIRDLKLTKFGWQEITDEPK